MAAHMDVHSRQNSNASTQKKRGSVHGGRPTRPAALTRRHTSSKDLATKRHGGISSKVNEDEDDIPTGFLQFCATCERQIVTPNNGILYCSDSCRIKDSCNSPSYPLHKNDTSDATYARPSSATSDEVTPFDLPLRSPTAAISDSPYFAPRHDYTWEESPAQSPNAHPPMTHAESEAARYLRQFYGPRPDCSRTNSTISTSIPSLTQVSTSIASSTIPYTPTDYSYSYTRALPARSHVRGSSTSLHNRSVDLVTPMIGIATAPASLDTLTDSRGSSASTLGASRRQSIEPFDGSGQSWAERSNGTSPLATSLKTLIKSSRKSSDNERAAEA